MVHFNSHPFARTVDGESGRQSILPQRVSPICEVRRLNRVYCWRMPGRTFPSRTGLSSSRMLDDKSFLSRIISLLPHSHIWVKTQRDACLTARALHPARTWEFCPFEWPLQRGIKTCGRKRHRKRFPKKSAKNLPKWWRLRMLVVIFGEGFFFSRGCYHHWYQGENISLAFVATLGLSEVNHQEPLLIIFWFNAKELNDWSAFDFHTNFIFERTSYIFDEIRTSKEYRLCRALHFDLIFAVNTLHCSDD